MNRVQKANCEEFLFTLKKHIYKIFKTNLFQYAMVLVLALILFSCIEILPIYYINLYVIQERITILIISILVISFCMHFFIYHEFCYDYLPNT